MNPRKPNYIGANGTVWVDGMQLHPDSHDCPHANEHACPTCDFDGYYEEKYGSVCPWFDRGDHA